MMPRVVIGLTLAMLVVILLAGCTPREKVLVIFQDITQASGLRSGSGMTHGLAWSDFDNDGLADLYLSNHLNKPQLLRNLGQGRFEAVNSLLPSFSDADDKHGALWADFDNDGKPDLVQLTGAGRGTGAEPKRLYRNTGKGFEEVAEAVGVDNPYGRTRMPLWFDFNNDGLLDLFQGAEARFDKREPPVLFLQQNGRFIAARQAIPFASRSPIFCMLTTLDRSPATDLICRVSGKNMTYQAFDISTHPARKLDILPTTAFEDMAIADFDNDGLMDIFMARRSPAKAVAFGRPNPRALLADIKFDKRNGKQLMGFRFTTEGALKVRIESAWPRSALGLQAIFLGETGEHPKDFNFTLPLPNKALGGPADAEPGKQLGVYIGKTGDDEWEFRLTAPSQALDRGKPAYYQIQISVEASTAITDVESIGGPVADERAPARLFMNKGAGKLVEESEDRGINQRLVAGVNAVAADFDNDMDVDIFVLASGLVGKQENLLLLNRGDGHFDVVAQAGGAGGDLTGVGDAVAYADIDNDGFLDLLIAQGGSMGRSLGLPSENGGYRLFRNVGNGNQWLAIELQGTRSNRDGIGAVVYVTAGGITQMRVQDGGQHNRAQNQARLHFGLGKHDNVDKIEILWPSGVKQTLKNIAAGKILKITEPKPD